MNKRTFSAWVFEFFTISRNFSAGYDNAIAVNNNLLETVET